MCIECDRDLNGKRDVTRKRCLQSQETWTKLYFVAKSRKRCHQPWEYGRENLRCMTREVDLLLTNFWQQEVIERVNSSGEKITLEKVDALGTGWCRSLTRPAGWWLVFFAALQNLSWLSCTGSSLWYLQQDSFRYILVTSYLATENCLLSATSPLLLLIFSMNDHPFHSCFKSFYVNWEHRLEDWWFEQCL